MKVIRDSKATDDECEEDNKRNRSFGHQVIAEKTMEVDGFMHDLCLGWLVDAGASCTSANPRLSLPSGRGPVSDFGGKART